MWNVYKEIIEKFRMNFGEIERNFCKNVQWILWELWKNFGRILAIRGNVLSRIYFEDTVKTRLSDLVGGKGDSDNRKSRIIRSSSFLTYDRGHREYCGGAYFFFQHF